MKGQDDHCRKLRRGAFSIFLLLDVVSLAAVTQPTCTAEDSIRAGAEQPRGDSAIPSASHGEPSRRAAIGAIFADHHTTDSALYVHRLAARKPADEQYEFLADWVLPGPSHASFRLGVAFTPTHPAPPAAATSSSDTVGALKGATRIQTGGELVSPALDLIAAASSLDRLARLRQHIAQADAVDELQSRCQMAMLGLVDLAAGDFDSAIMSFEELFARVEEKTYGDFAGRWPETLAVHAGLEHARTREVAAEMLYHMLQSQLRVGAAHGPDAWDRWVTAAAGRLTRLDSLRELDDAAVQRPTADPGLGSNWLPVSKTTAWSRGMGMPCAAWVRSPGQVTSVASHDDDYLYYRLPLRGNYEVECDVTSFSWRDSHLMIAGTYVAPIYDHVSYGIGSFRSARAAGVITPRLSNCDEWIRYRAIVRDGACFTYFNGRLVHTERLPEEHDPWLAIRSHSYTDGAVRHLRITGRPSVPRQVRMSASKLLTGWNAYHGEPIDGAEGYWRQVGELETGGEIVGQREPWLENVVVERLLQYHRPMLEDGTIEYEFYYRNGDSLVHPALDRRAFILNPHGIQLHWITDGVFERSALSPDNLSDEPEHRRGARDLPLRENSWNRMRLTLTGDTLTLTLNEELVYQLDLEPTNQRTFGLFHWADRTEARIRHVVWTGGWPRELPPVEKQELAGEGTRHLDERMSQLGAHLEYDFTDDDLPIDRFLTANIKREHMDVSTEGVRIVSRAGQGYRGFWICPNLQVEGDFDMRAEFENLQLSGGPDSSTGVYLMAITTDPETTHASVYRGCLRKPNAHDRVVMQAEFNRHKPDGSSLTWPGSTAEESTAGTLRLARRGETIYCLFAEADSMNFRLVHTEVVPREATRFDGIRLMSGITSVDGGPCEVAVTWKRLSIWAEKITVRPRQRSAPTPQPID